MIDLSEIVPSIFKAIIKAKLSDIEKHFSKGEVLQGKVTKTLGRNTVVVKLRGMELIAATRKPLVEGQSILVKVEMLKPQFTVSLLPYDTPVQEKTAALLRLYLPQAVLTGRLLTELGAIVSSLPKSALKGTGIKELLDEIMRIVTGDDDTVELTETGRTRVRGEIPRSHQANLARASGIKEGNLFQLLGLSHESEMKSGKPSKNLKRSLLILRRNLEMLAGKNPEKYRGAVSKVTQALQNIELRQLVNLDENQKVKSWEIPFWNGQEVSTARLYVRRDEKGTGKAGSQAGTNISLIVEMSRIGPVRTEAHLAGMDLVGAIYAGSEEAVREIEIGLPILIRSLEEKGFTSSFAVRLAKAGFLREKPEKGTSLPVKDLLNLKV